MRHLRCGRGDGQQHLEATVWNVQAAVDSYFAAPGPSPEDLVTCLEGRGKSEHLPAVMNIMVLEDIKEEDMVHMLSGMGSEDLSEFIIYCDKIYLEQPKQNKQN